MNDFDSIQEKQMNIPVSKSKKQDSNDSAGERSGSPGELVDLGSVSEAVVVTLKSEKIEKIEKSINQETTIQESKTIQETDSVSPSSHQEPTSDVSFIIHTQIQPENKKTSVYYSAREAFTPISAGWQDSSLTEHVEAPLTPKNNVIQEDAQSAMGSLSSVSQRFVFFISNSFF